MTQPLPQTCKHCTRRGWRARARGSGAQPESRNAARGGREECEEQCNTELIRNAELHMIVVSTGSLKYAVYRERWMICRHLWRLPEWIQHRLAGQHKGRLIVSQGVLFTSRRFSWILVSWLVEVRLIIQHKALDGDKHLQHGGIWLAPLLASVTPPGIQKAQANFPALIQVWVQPKSAWMVMNFLHKPSMFYKKIQWMALPIQILNGKMVSSGHILVGILGIQQGNGHRRRTIHHDMEFQLAQL